MRGRQAILTWFAILGACNAPDAEPEGDASHEPIIAEASVAGAGTEVPAAEVKTTPSINDNGLAVPPGPAEPQPPTAVATAEPPSQFRMCETCHSIERGAPHRLGPNLFAVVGAEAAGKDDYDYSEAMRSSGITWTAERLDAFLLDPRAEVPGTKMAVAGPGNAADRAAIISFLASQRE